MQILSFGADDVANAFAKLSPKELDDISYGVIQVDAKGRILLFNRAEAEIAGCDPKAAIDKNFFTEVAVCTNESGFRGIFDAGVKTGNLNTVFEWHLRGKSMPVVQVHLKSAVCGTKFWIFTKRL